MTNTTDQRRSDYNGVEAIKTAKASTSAVVPGYELPSFVLPVSVAEDALYWVQDGLDNADMDMESTGRTRRCRDALKKFIDENS